MDENAELKAALKEHGDQIKAKQAEMLTAVEGKNAELKAEIEKLEGLRKEMQTQLDAITTEQAKAKKENGAKLEKSFIEDLRDQLNGQIATFKKYKEDSTFKTAIDLKVKTFLESANASVTTGALIPWPEREIGVSKAPDRMPFLMNLIEVGGIASNVIYWVERKTRTDNTEFTAEGVAAANPLVLGYETKSLTMKALSEFIKVSNDSLDDIDYLLSEVRTELVTLMMLRVDHDILLGTIATNGYDGIDALATAFAVPNAFKLNPGDLANNKDVIRAAIAQLKIANFVPDYVIVNPGSAMEMDLDRDKTGEYSLAPFASINNSIISGVQVIENTGVAADAFYVGNFKKAKLFVRKDAELKVWEQNEDDAKTQLKTFTLYMRLAMRIKTADRLAFVKGTFTAGKALLNAI